MEYVYKSQRTCSTNIKLNVEDGVVKGVKVADIICRALHDMGY